MRMRVMNLQCAILLRSFFNNTATGSDDEVLNVRTLRDAYGEGSDMVLRGEGENDVVLQLP